MGETRVCAQVFVYAAFVIIAVVLVNHVKTSCPGPLKYYEDLGCTPVYKNNSRCATRYDCDHVYARSRLKCYINGHDYAINRALRQQDANHCEELCVCKRGYANDDIPAFDCIDIKSLCPKKRVKHGCYLSHDLSTCCGDPKEICPGPMKERHVCIVDTKVYMDGEYFPAKEDPRLTCVCKPGYEGKNVPPFCVRGNHSVCDNPAFSHKNYFRKKCVPIFKKILDPDSCFVDVKCQDANDMVIRAAENKLGKNWYDEKNMCLFGNLTMRIGDTLKQFQPPLECVKCTCEVPPVPTCETLMKNGSCNMIFNPYYKYLDSYFL